MSFLYLRTTQKYRLSVGAGFEARLNGLPALEMCQEKYRKLILAFHPDFILVLYKQESPFEKVH